MDIEKIATIEVEPSPVKYGVDCLVCGNLIPMMLHPKICEECKRRLIHVLYPEREEDEP